MIITDDETVDPESASNDLLRTFGPLIAMGTARCLYCWQPVTTTPALVIPGMSASDGRGSQMAFLYLHPRCAEHLAKAVRKEAAQVLGDTRRVNFKPVSWQRLRELNRERTWLHWCAQATTPEELDTVKQHVQREYLALEKLRALDPTA